MTVHDLRRDAFDGVGPPGRVAVLVDDRGADAFDEVMPGNARQRDAVVLLEAFFDPGE